MIIQSDFVGKNPDVSLLVVHQNALEWQHLWIEVIRLTKRLASGTCCHMIFFWHWVFQLLGIDRGTADAIHECTRSIQAFRFCPWQFTISLSMVSVRFRQKFASYACPSTKLLAWGKHLHWILRTPMVPETWAIFVDSRVIQGLVTFAASFTTNFTRFDLWWNSSGSACLSIYASIFISEFWPVGIGRA